MSENHTEYNQEFFKNLLPRYDWVVWPLRPLRRRVVSESQATPGMKVLDVACGTGEQSIAFAKAGCSVVGIDLSEGMLAKAKEKVRENMDIVFEHHDASSLPFSNEYFDISTVSLGLHDMPEKMALAVLQEMKRTTKRDGKIVIVEHNKSPNFFGRLIHRIMLRSDTRYYPLFIQKGLDSYLQTAQLQREKYFTVLCGIIQVAICRKEGNP